MIFIFPIIIYITYHFNQDFLKNSWHIQFTLEEHKG